MGRRVSEGMIEMSKHSTAAVELFEEGFNCSQSIIGAFCDETGMALETALKIGSSFGGGMGRLREVCGAVSGMFLVAGILFGYTDPKDREAKAAHYRLIQNLAEQFRDRNKTIICRELLAGSQLRDGVDPEERTPEYYQHRPCAGFVEQAASILDEYITANCKVKQQEQEEDL